MWSNCMSTSITNKVRERLKWRPIFIIFIGALFLILLVANDGFEIWWEFSRTYEHLELDEIIFAFPLFIILVMWFMHTSRFTQIMKKIKQSETLAQQQKHELELYASLIQHDFRNDLAVIITTIETTVMMIHEDETKIPQMLSSALGASERMLKLLKSLSQFSETEMNDIATIIKSVSMQAQKIESNLHINTIFDEGTEDLRVQGNRLIPTVFENIFRNAAKHAGKNPTVQVRVVRDGNTIKILISDDGPGIPEEILGRIFQKGVSSSGGGLGLYLSREILSIVGGSIELLETSRESGATFEITLPLLEYP